MKKIIILSFISVLFLVSCAESKAVVDAGKNVRGDWTITNVTVDGINPDHVNVMAFHQADYKCFIGSTWRLIQNNSSGNYTLNGGPSCPSETTQIKWFLTEENGAMMFKFKKIYEGEKPKNVVDGYNLRVVNNDGNHLVLRQDMMFEGKAIGINYSFSRN